MRDEPRYRAALTKAAGKARARSVEDIVINSTKKGEAYKLRIGVWRVNEHHRDHEQQLQFREQAFELAPKDSAVLYDLACAHSLLGHEKRALIFLDKAVDGGFYCPAHISKDPDLKRIRSTKRFEATLARARELATEVAVQQSSGKLTLVKGIADRVMNAVGVIDYVATVETTEGYAVRAETVAALVPGAESRPIYRVFGGRKPLRNFDRYLPQETLSFSVSNGLDLAALYTYIEDTMREAGPNGQELLGTWVEIQAKIGFDLKKDLLGWLEGGVVSITLEEHRGWVVLLKVTDEQTAREKVGDTLDLLARELGGVAAVIPQLGMLTFSRSPVQHEQLDGFENVRFMISPTPFVWGVADGHLIVGASADAVALCLDTARGGHPNIRQNPRVMTEALLPPEPFTSVMLSDRRHLGDQLAMGFGMVSMIGGPLSMGIEDQEARTTIARIVGMVAKLPPVVSKIDFYKSTAAYTTFDGRAWRTRAVTHYMSPEEHAARKPPPVPTAPKVTQGL